MEGTLTPTYSLNQGDGMGFGGSGIWLFAILALFFFGGGAWGNRGGNAVTVDDINNTSNFTRLENQVRANAELTERKTDAISNGICSLGYEMANKFATLEASTTAQIQSVKDMIQQNEIQTLRDQLGQVQLNQALNGVVRYPNGFVYSAGSSPFCGCNCQNI